MNISTKWSSCWWKLYACNMMRREMVLISGQHSAVQCTRKEGVEQPHFHHDRLQHDVRARVESRWWSIHLQARTVSVALLNLNSSAQLIAVKHCWCGPCGCRNIEDITTFPGSFTSRHVSYAIKQMLAREVSTWFDSGMKFKCNLAVIVKSSVV